MNIDERLRLITRNTAEIVTEDELKKLLTKKSPTVYLGTAITGRPHIAYFVWVLKLSDFLRAGFHVKVLLADLHGALDNCPWDLLEKRYNYYTAVIKLLFTAVGVDVKNLTFVKGSDFQLKKEYVLDMLRLATHTTINDAKRAASEVVKFGDNPKLSGIIYPLMQALDEQYLDTDVQYGGVDQRKILMYAREFLPKVGYKPRIEIMTPLIPGLVGKKMSSSDVKSKIDLLDDEKTVKDKVNSAHCVAGDVNDNGVLAFTQHVLMVLKGDRSEPFLIKRPEKYGGNISYSSYSELEKDYAAQKLFPLDLKNAVADELNKLLKPFRDKRADLLKIAKDAYTE
ncbi:MAG TPA: tyrosine--tRNA ligase [Candidatus Nanoarchaeia archaeon]|nr:tyrosine--tRNA ligase [Candidatus Nanoarchaeia archaeon]